MLDFVSPNLSLDLSLNQLFNEYPSRGKIEKKHHREKLLPNLGRDFD